MGLLTGTDGALVEGLDRLVIEELEPESTVERPSGGTWKRKGRTMARRVEVMVKSDRVIVQATHREALAVMHAVDAAPHLDWSSATTTRQVWLRRHLGNFDARGQYELEEVPEGSGGSFPGVVVTP
jgi:hypothetical protein